jgi:tricorn protease
MLGELGRSHLGYYGYGDEIELPRDTTADFGVIWDEDYAGPGWRVACVLHDGPAIKAGSELYAGDIVLAIDGEETVAGENRAARLNNRVDKPLMLTVKSSEEALVALAEAAATAAEDSDEDEANEADDEAEAEPDLTEREVPIKPVSRASMRTPLYEQWVEDNREAVYQQGDGRIAYQHVRSMNQPGADKFRRELFSESFDKDALIIDVRFNGGGWTAVMIMNILNEVPAYLRARRDQPFQNFGRQYIWQGPIVVMCNRHSFSNAEIFSHIMKDTGMATLIGEPTPGGVISTSSYELMDGSRVAIPGGANWRLTGENMETGGAIPDIVVYIDPHALAEGHDNQLETAVEFLLGEIE